MSKTFITSLAILGLASAQSSVVSLFIPDTDPQPLVASIMGNDATATTYYLTCPAGTDDSDCGMGPGMTYISGPKTAALTMSEPDEDFYGGIFCSMGGTTTAICTTSMSGAGANFPGVSSETLTTSDIELLPVTITAGSTTPVSASASATATGAVAATPARASSSEAASKTSGSSTFATSATSKKASGTASTAAGSQITANAKLVMGLGGAIVAGVVAAM